MLRINKSNALLVGTLILTMSLSGCSTSATYEGGSESAPKPVDTKETSKSSEGVGESSPKKTVDVKDATKSNERETLSPPKTVDIKDIVLTNLRDAVPTGQFVTTGKKLVRP